MDGKFITLEGGEGCGKSTQAKLLAEYLEKQGIATVLTKEPGSTPEGKILRRLLVTGEGENLDAVSESLLYYADRRCNLTQIVWPSLKAGKWVISDRYADSTEAYQYFGYNKRVPYEILQSLYEIVAGDFKPDLTIILDMDPEIGMQRSFAKAAATGVEELRFESKTMEFHHNLRRGFLQIASRNPNRCAVVDADTDVETLHGKLVDLVKARLKI